MSPSKGALRQKPLPSDMLERMKAGGWTQTGFSNRVWLDQARHLTSSRSGIAPAAAGCRATLERTLLLESLEQQAVPQGIEALRAALRWRCGSLERAFECSNVSDRTGPANSLSLLECVGALVLLGLDAPALCGFSESVAFRAMDTDMDGRLSLRDLLGTSSPSTAPQLLKLGTVASVQRGVVRGNGVQGIEGGAERWVLLIKFVALTAWFSTPMIARRNWRNPPAGQEAGSSLGTGKKMEPGSSLGTARPEVSGGGIAGAMIVVTALAEGATGRTSHAAVARQQISDPVRQCWAPSEDDFQAVESKMWAEFENYSTVQQYGEKMLSKANFFSLLGDIPPQDIGDDAESMVTRAQIGQIFDEVLTVQARTSGQNGVTFSKGLTFESFRLALLKASAMMGLHFRHLVDDAIDAQAATPEAM